MAKEVMQVVDGAPEKPTLSRCGTLVPEGCIDPYGDQKRLGAPVCPFGIYEDQTPQLQKPCEVIVINDG